MNFADDRLVTNRIRDLIGEHLDYRQSRAFLAAQDEPLTKTQIIDLTGGQKPFTLDELIKILPAELSEQTEPINDASEDYDFIILVGKDMVDVHSYEEGTLEDLESEELNQEYLELLK
jgi:hypothetical protein